MRLKLVVVPDKSLREKSKAVGKVTTAHQRLASGMEELILSTPGAVALAAVQVGILIRLAVIVEESGLVTTLINPVILGHSEGFTTHNEGCLSVPGLNYSTPRYDFVNVKFTNLSGKKEEREFMGLAARAVQHELDHMDGILFVQRNTYFKDMAEKEIQEKALLETVKKD